MRVGEREQAGEQQWLREDLRVGHAGVPDLDQVEREAIQKALEATRFNKTAAAKLLGITFRSLRYRLDRLGID